MYLDPVPARQHYCQPTSRVVLRRRFRGRQLHRHQTTGRGKVWDGSGLWVCAKRLEKGRFTWPQLGDAQGKLVLSHEELSLLLGGIDLAKTKHKRWYRKVSPEGHAAA
jgi:transposase